MITNNSVGDAYIRPMLVGGVLFGGSLDCGVVRRNAACPMLLRRRVACVLTTIRSQSDSRDIVQ